MNVDTRPRRAVAIGASAGGVEALREISAGLPADFPAPVLVVLHVPATDTSHLPEILERAGGPFLPRTRQTGIRSSRERSTSPPDRHLMVADGRVLVVRGPRENMHRPAVDPLFRSVAVSFGPNAIGVVLSGTRADGSAGSAAISHRGGAVIVQDPGEAIYPDMPLSAIAADHPAYVLPVAQIPAAVTRLTAEPLKKVSMDDHGGLTEDNRYASLDQDAIGRDEGIGKRAPFGCPECGGALWEVADGDLLRFRCRAGHAYAADTLIEAQGQTLDNSSSSTSCPSIGATSPPSSTGRPICA
jgi:two-component system chemotaxis response regulator CheB